MSVGYGVDLNTVERSLQAVERWVEDRDYKGYEPFDGLSSYLHPLTFGNLLLERLLQQSVRQSPVNLRPLLGIVRQESTKGRGYMAWGYLHRYRQTGELSYAERARSCLRWLADHKAPGYRHHSWGNHFPFSSRVGKLPRFEPIIVWTSLIGQAFLEGYRLLGEQWCLDVARSICSWILAIPRERTSSGTCLSYVAFEQRSIHNSNMLGAAMLASTAQITHEQELLETAHEAMRYSCTRQLPNGSWYYGEGEGYHWIDAFHTGYNLDSLERYISSTRDGEFLPNLVAGLAFFKSSFFDEEGRVKYYDNRLYPIDIQCVSQAIDTLCLCARHDDSLRELAGRVAGWAIDHMQSRSGSFHYRHLPTIKVKTPMLHWGQATMYKALALLLSQARGKEHEQAGEVRQEAASSSGKGAPTARGVGAATGAGNDVR